MLLSQADWYDTVAPAATIRRYAKATEKQLADNALRTAEYFESVGETTDAEVWRKAYEAHMRVYDAL